LPQGSRNPRPPDPVVASVAAACGIDVAIVDFDDDKGDIVPRNIFIGELEQLVLLGLLQLGEEAYALPLREILADLAGRKISRGGLYRTLDRLEGKGYVTWELEEQAPDRGGHPRRRFRVTRAGVGALRASRQALLRLWDGLEGVLR
jgi:DNA-binding PadR family transcriptional regulator